MRVDWIDGRKIKEETAVAVARGRVRVVSAKRRDMDEYFASPRKNIIKQGRKEKTRAYRRDKSSRDRAKRERLPGPKSRRARSTLQKNVHAKAF